MQQLNLFAQPQQQPVPPMGRTVVCRWLSCGHVFPLAFTQRDCTGRVLTKCPLCTGWFELPQEGV